MRNGALPVAFLLMLSMAPLAARAQQTGREIYMKRCFWCHGEQGRGDGPAAVGMIPQPRDLVAAEYKIRSTPYGQLPTDEDLFRVISAGLPGTPMPGWEKVLSEAERREIVAYLKSLSPRFQSEKPEPLSIPSGRGLVERGKQIFQTARCFVCHGESGRADGGITTALNFEWGWPYSARDFTQGWTFKGGHEPRDIYLRITGGLNGTPMGPYQELLSDQERWDLAHYVASLDDEASETSSDFAVVAAYIDGEIPNVPDAAGWKAAAAIRAPLSGQVVLDPPSRWWTPTVRSATVRALWNGREIGFLLEWNDPAGPNPSLPDSALLQFAVREESKPYFLLGNRDDPVKVWRWNESGDTEEWMAAGSGEIASHPHSLQVSSSWNQGRWQVIFRGPIGQEPAFEPGRFVPIWLLISDGANGEVGNLGGISTWVYVTLNPPASFVPWLSAVAWLLGALLLQFWVVSRLKS